MSFPFSSPCSATFVEHRTSKRLKLSGLEAGAAISRDIFMVGVYTAQRISDKYDYFD